MRNVLIVDDEEDIRECLQMAIKPTGFNMIMAHDGEDAWEKINSFEIDLVITDYRMPNMDGAKLSTLISQNYPAVPIILISTFSPKALGIQDIIRVHLPKPFDIDMLKEEIETILEKAL